MSLDSRNDDLNKKIEDTDLPNAVAVLLKDARKRRRQLRWLATALALDFLLMIAIAVLLVRTSDIAKLSQSNQQALIQNCETANDSRTKQLTLWRYVLSITPDQPRTPEQEAMVKDFTKFIQTTFAPRDCQAEADNIK